MTLGKLKKSLAKHPPDMDDMEIIIQDVRDGKETMDLLVFVGYLPLPGKECIILGTWKAMDKLIKDGKLEKPDDYTEPPEEE